ncbi:GntR family transcriptional regulator [Muricoccus aerilatus]|uniref:GntR family transcriptional regulator n=1 Tax=Muricoccus aerilatus TaxID=452982 RepID=UPI0006943351|nr:GntR family transcriptional regulator [Roseomonas aerilata]
MNSDPSPELPLYRRVLDGLRAEIRAGALPVGSALPSEKELGAQYGVSRITVRRAMDALAQEGLIARSPGRPARVAEPRLIQVIAAFEDATNPLRFVRGTEVRLLAFEWRLADGAIARALGIEEGDQMLRIERLRHQDGAPVFHTVSHLPAPVGALLNRRTLESSSLYDALGAAGHVPASTERQMGAAPCPRAVAPLLGMRPGEPTFRTERLSRDAAGHPLHLLSGHWRWDRFSMRLISGPAGKGGQLSIEEAIPGAVEINTYPDE